MQDGPGRASEGTAGGIAHAGGLYELRLELAGRWATLRGPIGFEPLLRTLTPLGPSEASDHRPAERPLVEVRKDAEGAYSVLSDCAPAVHGLTPEQAAHLLVEETGRALIVDQRRGLALHAGAVHRHGRAMLVAGISGAGKTSAVAWLLHHGFHYLSDELVVVDQGEVSGFRRPLVVKPGARDAVHGLDLPGRVLHPGGPYELFDPSGPGSFEQGLPVGLIVFVQFVAGADLSIEALTPALAATRLMAVNLNARNLPDDGLPAALALARRVPAIHVRHGGFASLEGVLEPIADWALMRAPSPMGLMRLLRGLAPDRSVGRPATEDRGPRGSVPADEPAASVPAPSSGAGTPEQSVHARPEATAARYPGRLTIGMATYDDYDGTYFSIQSLRMFHPEILEDTEFVVVDNHPDGQGAAALKDLEKWIPRFRYIPFSERSGRAVRDEVFAQASGEIVLCIDCHVMIEPGAITRLLRYVDQHPGTLDLLQGPLIYDDLKTLSTHFEPVWNRGMWGRWATDPRGTSPDDPPFEIPMQGLGLFACRRAAWPGFNPAFQGFGGEEGYLHEKFRQRGGATLCLPFLRWLHRFKRPAGVPYRLVWEDRIWNYWVGWQELGLAVEDIDTHFRSVLGDGPMDRIRADIERRLEPCAAGAQAQTADSWQRLVGAR